MLKEVLLNNHNNNVVGMWENCPTFLMGAFHIFTNCGNVSRQEFSTQSVGNSIKSSHISTISLQHITCGKLAEFSTN